MLTGNCMKSSFLKAIRNLLPNSSQWNLKKNTDIRKLFEAIAVLPEDLRREIELVYLDYFPDSTRCLEKWEEIFQIIFTQQELEQRRQVLQSIWLTSQGGQSLPFLEAALQLLYSEIKIVENVPLSNPRKSNIAYFCVCGNETMVCGNAKAICNYREGDESFIPQIIRNDTASPYSIPSNADYWAFCFYVCKRVIRNERRQILYVEKLQIPIVFKNYIEYLILRIKPLHTVAVMDIEWMEA